MIRTKRLELVEFDIKYASDLYELWSDFEVIKYTYMPKLTKIFQIIYKNNINYKIKIRNILQYPK